MKIKDLKEHPLLSAPAEGEWWKPTMGDVDVILKSLREYRAEGGGPMSMGPSRILGVHHSMSVLGLPYEVTKEDEEAIRGLVKDRDDGFFLDIRYRLKMRAIGMSVEITDEDRERVRKRIAAIRKGDFSVAVWKYFALARQLGLDLKPTRKNIEQMIFDVKLQRGGERVLNRMADMYGEIKLAGVPISPTEEELKDFEKMRKDLRRDGAGYELASLLADLHLIIQPGETQQTPPVPPLKRLGDRLA